jgi:hypothetical protein
MFTDDGVSIMFSDGYHVTVYDHMANYSALKEALRAEDWELAKDLSNPVVAVSRAIANVSETIKIDNGIVYYNGTALHTELTDRMVSMVDDGFDVKPLGIFLDNLMENPSSRAVDELFGFLAAGDMPITEDGHFLAYKRIRSNWTDCHSGKIDNSIGATVSMSRNKVDDNCNNTCSSGLHFCSREYIQNFWGERLVVVKIDPRDVVSIPVDYNNTKGRCCRYTVIAEIEQERRLEGAFKHTSEFWDDQDLYDAGDINIDFFDKVDSLNEGTISPRTILGATSHGVNHPAEVQVEDILDVEGYVDSTRVKELDEIDLDECCSEPESVTDHNNVLGVQYWLGEVGPFRTKTEAVYAQAHALSALSGK